jgi:sRNA-binding carbon storage regulator CsrA
MLNLQRRKGQQVYIGDEVLTVIEVSNTYVIVKYLEALHIINKGKTVHLSPTTIIHFNRRQGSEARLGFQATLPIYRSEIYEQRRLPQS